MLNLNMNAANHEGFETHLKINYGNDGQLLGVWLSKRGGIPYLYFTIINDRLPGQDKVRILSKFDTSLEDFAQVLAELLSKKSEMVSAA